MRCHFLAVSSARRFALAALIISAMISGAFAGSASAAWQPTKPITFIVMAGKGGGADKAVRFLSEVMVKNNLTPVPFEIVNLPGDSGAEALTALKAKSGDNHTLMFTLNSFYTVPINRPELNLKLEDFTPIARLGMDVFLLWVSSAAKDIVSIDDFVAAAKNKGKDWVMAGTGSNSEDNMLTDFLNATYGLQMTYKPMKGGGAVAQELAEGRAQSTVNNPAEQVKFYKEGLTKPIVAITPVRIPRYRKTPTLRETGMDFHYFMQRSVVGPGKMEPQATLYYTKLFEQVFASEQWQAYRLRNSLEGELISGDKLQTFWAGELEKHNRWKMVLELMLPQ